MEVLDQDVVDVVGCRNVLVLNIQARVAVVSLRRTFLL